MHTVDVLIPTYKPKPGHLTAALESLLAQTFQDWRCLVHDDAAEDSCAMEIVRPFLGDPRITFERSEKRLGIGGNWNACFVKTSAPFVAYLFQDDRWNRDYLESAIRILEKNRAIGLVSLEHAYGIEGNSPSSSLYNAVREFRRSNVTDGWHSGRQILHFWIEHGLHPNIIGEPSFVVYRRSSMEQAGRFLEDMPQCLDQEYSARVLLVSDWYNLADRDYGSFRVHESGTSALNQQAGIGLYDRLRCFEELIRCLKYEERTLAIRSRNREVEMMVRKFLSRTGNGVSLGTGGKGFLLCFAFRHPFVIGWCVLKAMFGNT